MANQKDEAERLRIGIRGGWLPIEDAAAWADKQIAQTPEPHAALFELASPGRRPREAIVALLDSIPGTADPIASMRWCLSDLLDTVNREPHLAHDLARWIETTAHEGGLPEAEFGWEPLALGDAFSLAEQGSFETVDEARERLRSFLREHGTARV